MASRRDALTAGGSLLAATMAGCLSSLPFTGDGDSKARYHRWLGEEVAETQLHSLQQDGIDFIQGFQAISPADAATNDHLPDQFANRWTADATDVQVGTRTVGLDPAAVDLQIYDHLWTFGVTVGSFDADEVTAGLGDSFTKTGEHGDYETYTGPPALSDRYDSSEILENFRCSVGVGDGTLAVAQTVPTEDAVSYATAILDTGEGDAPRFVDTDDAFGTLVDELGGGTWVGATNVGNPVPNAIRIDLDGDTARRKSISFFQTAEAATSQKRWIEDELVESGRNRTDDRPRTHQDKFAPYEDVEVGQQDRYVTVDGTLPTANLGGIDMAMP